MERRMRRERRRRRREKKRRVRRKRRKWRGGREKRERREKETQATSGTETLCTVSTLQISARMYPPPPLPDTHPTLGGISVGCRLQPTHGLTQDMYQRAGGGNVRL